MEKLLKPQSIFFALALSLAFSVSVFAAPPSSPYAPGETLNPSCAPGDTNCAVDTTLFPYITTTDAGATSTFAGNAEIDGSLNLNGQLMLGGSAGFDGYVLQSTGSGAVWVSTSTLGFALASEVPTAASTTQWNVSYSWGDHSTQNYFDTDINTTSDLTEGSNLFFTIERGQDAISENIAGIDYSSGVFSLSSGYVIPLIASTTQWDSSFAWGDHSVQNYFDLDADTTTDLTEGSKLFFTDERAQDAISENIAGIDYSSGEFSLSSGYVIPLTASTTQWSDFYTTPSSRIAAGTGLLWTGNTLSNTGVLSIGGLTGVVATSSLGIVSSQWTTDGSDIRYTGGSLITQGLSVGGSVVQTSPDDIALVAATSTTHNAFDVDVEGKYAYVLNQVGFRIYDISTASSPSFVGSISTSNPSLNVDISGNYAYIADNGANAVRVIDVSNPASPTQVSTYSMSSAYDVQVVGNYAYAVGWGSGLRVVNISNPASPSLVGSAAGTFVDVFVSGSYAYVLTNAASMLIYNISNPASPSLVSTTAVASAAQELYVKGGYAYVAAEGQGLRIYNVSVPSAPVYAGVYDTPGSVNGVEIRGSYAYLADGGSGLKIVDISNPASPTLVDSVTWAAVMWGIDVSGSYAYIAGDASGFAIFNAMPVTETDSLYSGIIQTGSLSVGSGIYAGGTITGSGLSITSATSTTPAATFSVGSVGIGTTSPSSKLSVAGDINLTGALRLSGDAGTSGYILQTTSTSSRWIATSSLGIVSSQWTSSSTNIYYTTGNVGIGTTTPGYGLTVAGTTYLANSVTANGGIVVNGSIRQSATSTDPKLVGTLGFASHLNDVVMYGNYAYAAHHSNDLQVIDISNPASPTLLYSQNAGSHFGLDLDISSNGNYVYMASGLGVFIFNVTTPASPTQTAFISASFATNVKVVGNYMYIMTSDAANDLLIYNISTPASPTLVGSLSIAATNGGSVFIKGNYAYIVQFATGDSADFFIVNISNPASPSLVATYNAPDFTYNLQVSGNYAYLAGGNDGLVIYDISDPANATQVGAYDQGGSIKDVYIVANRAFIVDSFSPDRVRVLDISNPISPTLIGTSPSSYWIDDIFVKGNTIYASGGSGGGFKIFSISSFETPSLYAEDLSADTLDLVANLTSGGTLSGVGVTAGLSGIISTGGLTVSSSASTTPSAIFSVGNVGIGTSSPRARLDLFGLAGSADIFAISSSTNARLVTVTSGGRVGIGTSSPQYALHVVGDDGSGNVAKFSTTGGLTSCTLDAGTGLLNCSSDERLKKDIESLGGSESASSTEESSLDKILKLRPVSYHWKTEDSSDALKYGFIAQEMEDIFPELVQTDGQTGYKSIGMSGLIPFIVDALQEVIQRFDGLADLLKTKEVQTDKLCLDDVCITKTELSEILQGKAMVPAPSDPEPEEEQEEGLDEGGGEEAEPGEIPEDVPEEEAPAEEEAEPAPEEETLEEPAEEAPPAEEPVSDVE